MTDSLGQSRVQVLVPRLAISEARRLPHWTSARRISPSVPSLTGLVNPLRTGAHLTHETRDAVSASAAIGVSVGMRPMAALLAMRLDARDQGEAGRGCILMIGSLLIACLVEAQVDRSSQQVRRLHDHLAIPGRTVGATIAVSAISGKRVSLVSLLWRGTCARLGVEVECAVRRELVSRGFPPALLGLLESALVLAATVAQGRRPKLGLCAVPAALLLLGVARAAKIRRYRNMGGKRAPRRPTGQPSNEDERPLVARPALASAQDEPFRVACPTRRTELTGRPLGSLVPEAREAGHRVEDWAWEARRVRSSVKKPR